MKRVGFFLAVIVASLPALHAEQLLPLPLPSLQLLTEGTVYAAARAPDGSVVFGGEFSYVNGVARARIARLLPDGTLDPAWNPGCDGTVYALAVAPDGSVYAGGIFTNAGGSPRSFLAKLTGTGTGLADPAWDAPANLTVHALAIDADGNLYAAGQFSAIGGAPHAGIAKLSGSSAAADPGWNAQVYDVRSIAVGQAGAIFIAGVFSTVSDVPRYGLAKLSAATGAVDPDWDAASVTDSYAIATDNNGSVFVGRLWGDIGGEWHSGSIKLSAANGAIDEDWDPVPSARVSSLAIDGSGNIYLGGEMAFPEQDGVVTVVRASLSGTGTMDATFAPGSISVPPLDNLGTVNAIVFTPGRVIVAGKFAGVGDSMRMAFAALSVDTGGALAPLDAGVPGTVYALLPQADGGMLVGGDFFVAAPTVARPHLLRLAPDGTLDLSWNVPANAMVQSFETDPDGSIYVGGSFTVIGGEKRSGIAKLIGENHATVDTTWEATTGDFLDGSGGGVAAISVGQGDSMYVLARGFAYKLSCANGERDVNWFVSPGIVGGIGAMAADAAGAVYLGGAFQKVNLVIHPYLAKVSGSGTAALDPDWNPLPDSTVNALSLRGGQLFVGGSFSSIGGQVQPRIARISTTDTGQADPTFTSPFGSPGALGVDLMASSGDDVFVATNIFIDGGSHVSSVYKLSAETGAIDSPWNPLGDQPILALAGAGDGSIYVGGAFQSIAGVQRYSLAAFPLLVPDSIFASGFDQ